MFGFGNKNENAGGYSNASTMIRVIAGGYVAYMGWELCKSVITGENPGMIFMAFGLLFILVGGFFVVNGIMSYMQNQKLQKEEDAKAAALAAETEEIEEYEEIEADEEIEESEEREEEE